ncbi:hypothetical protein P9F13_16505 [Alkalihalophilus marmarensis]|nr:hypothetical protein [Alkalihalophilus marmarensis]
MCGDRGDPQERMRRGGSRTACGKRMPAVEINNICRKVFSSVTSRLRLIYPPRQSSPEISVANFSFPR